MQPVGNVWEWCYEWFDPRIYGRGVVTNPRADHPTRHVNRGLWHLERHTVGNLSVVTLGPLSVLPCVLMIASLRVCAGLLVDGRV